MFQRTILATLGFLFLVQHVGAQQAAPGPEELDKRLIDAAKKDSELMKNLQYLSDVIGPRMTGSENLKKANDWAADVMKSYGLQNVHLEPWEIPTGWKRGTATMKLVEPNNGRTLFVASRAWTPGIKGKQTCNVVAITARTRAQLAEYKGKLKNAVVLVGPPATVAPITNLSYPAPESGPRDPKEKAKEEPKQAPPKTEQPKENIREFLAFRRELGEFLRTEGIAMSLSDAGKPHNLLTMTGSWPTDPREKERLPALFIAHEHYALLHRLCTASKDAKVQVEVELTNEFIPGPITVYNTVGEIPGKKKDEFVVIGAHIDSWDLAQGTTDNGTGTCTVLEAARILAKSGVVPERTIRFVLFSGEEQGLHGSKEYCKRHKDEMPKTSMALVHDTGTGRVQGFYLSGRSAVKTIFEKELVSLKPLGLENLSIRSMNATDHAAFEQVGVPGFACIQDMSEYRLTHHTQTDTFDKANEGNLIQGVQIMAVTAMRVANLPELLPRERTTTPKKEPKAEPGK